MRLVSLKNEFESEQDEIEQDEIDQDESNRESGSDLEETEELESSGGEYGSEVELLRVTSHTDIILGGEIP